MSVLCAANLALLGFGFGTQELIIVAIVFLVLFGGARLPSLMRNMGRSINEFKAGMADKPSDSNNDRSDKKRTDTIEDRSDED